MAIGVKHHKHKSGTITLRSFVGYCYGVDKVAAQSWTAEKWKTLHPKLKPEVVAVMEIPAAMVPPSATDSLPKSQISNQKSENSPVIGVSLDCGGTGK